MINYSISIEDGDIDAYLNLEANRRDVRIEEYIKYIVYDKIMKDILCETTLMEK